MLKKFDKRYAELIAECISSKKIIKEGFISDVINGSVKGGAIGAGLGAVFGAAGGPGAAAAMLGAGGVIGVPLGAIAGAGKWFKDKLGEKFFAQSDEDKVKKLIEKIDNKEFTIKDAEELDEIVQKYKSEIKEKTKEDEKQS